MKCCIVLIIIVAIFSLIISCSKFEPTLGNANLDTLDLVHIVYRHGDRAPIWSYPKDPIGNESVWYPYADGFGALTKKGREEHFELGKYWRTRYEGFIDDVYTPKEILALSSDLDRTIMSCLADLAGMWPPNPKDSKSEWNPNPNYAWQPIPIHTIPKKLDNFIGFNAECPRFQEAMAEYRSNSSFVKSINSDPNNKALYEYLAYHTGFQVDDFQRVGNIYDTLKIQKLYGMAVPDWVDVVYAQMAKLAPLDFDPRAIVPTTELKRLKAGPLLNFIVTNMDLKRDSPTLTQAQKDTTRKAKMYMISGHDTTIAILLGTLGVFETQIPPYACSVILEMHRGTTAQNANERFIRVFFRNETAAPYEFEVPGCGYPCNVDTFKKLFSNILVNDTEWEKACVARGAVS